MKNKSWMLVAAEAVAAAATIVLAALGPVGCGSDGGGPSVNVPPMTEHYGYDVYRFVSEGTNGTAQKTTLWLSGHQSNGVFLAIKMFDDVKNPCSALLEGRAIGPYEMEVTGGRVNQDGSDTPKDDPVKPAKGYVTLAGDWLTGSGIQVGLISGCKFDFVAQLEGKDQFYEVPEFF